MKIKMKSIFNLLSAIILASVLLGGCTKDFEEINTNTRVLSELDKATIGNVFARVQYRGMLYRNRQIFHNLFAENYCQYFSITQTKFPSDRYEVVGGWVDADWRSFYSNGANNLEIVLNLTTPEENDGMEVHHAITQVTKVLCYQQMTDYWGPMPYFEVGKGGNSVPYDTQESIYNDFFHLLDTALIVLNQNGGGNGFGAHDQYYNGDVDSWIRLANSLKLRCAMRVSDVDPNAQRYAEEAVSGGVISETSQDAIFHVTENSYNLLNRMVPWNEFRMSATMESVLKGYDDPRMPMFYGPTEDSMEAGTDEWHGLRNGYSISDLGVIPELANKATSRMAVRWQNNADRGTNNIQVMHSSEVYFLRAEGALKGWNMGSGSAQSFYEKGIRQSLTMWVPGISTTDVDAYIASNNTPATTFDVGADIVFDTPIAWSGDANVQLEQIARQKWLALYPNGLEAWADVRRAERPMRYDIMQSDNPFLRTDELIRRIPFVSSEYETNAEAVEAAKGLLKGADNAATKLWWDK